LNALRSSLFFIFLCLISIAAALWLRGGTDATLFVLLDQWSSNVSTQFSELKDSAFEAAGLSAPLQPESVSINTSGMDRNFTSSTTIAIDDHTSDDRQACGRPHTKSRSATDSHPIYKWIDEAGQTHMSDERPAGRIATVMDMGMKKQDFTYNIVADGVTVPIDFPGQLAAGSKRIYDIWHYFLGEEKLRQSRVEVLLIGSPERFNAYHAKVSPTSKPVNGFYSMGINQAVVSFDAARMDRTLGTTFHEVSHLITASHLGPTPPWLTEGLAEYFETMQVTGQTGDIHPNQDHIKLLKQTRLPGLREYLSIDRPDWHQEHRDRNYAIAWSLMHFLLEGAPGMYALREVIQQAEINFCKPFSAVDVLNNAYPGGLQRLEQDWRTWLSNGGYQIHQT
jgi:hypothetical protein